MTDTTATATTPAPAPTPVPAGERILRAAANFFSFIFSPLLAPSYAIIAAWSTTVMLLLPQSTMRTLFLVVFGLTCLFPLIAIGVMYKVGIVSDPGLNKRRERNIPFIISGVAYLACFLFFRHINAPGWLTMFIIGGLVALVIAALVNLRWKISIHLTAMGGLVAFIIRLILNGQAMFFSETWLMGSIIAAGLVGTSRLLLRRHTLGQVGAGFANGFLCVIIMTAFA